MADLNTLPELFEDELRDVYDAEKQIVKALPKVASLAQEIALTFAISIT